MVPDSRTPARPAQLRPLNEPVPVPVIARDNRPARVVLNGKEQAVERIQDTWIIEDEWWRQPIARQYYALLLEDGTRRTVFHDRIGDAWYLQDY